MRSLVLLAAVGCSEYDVRAPVVPQWPDSVAPPAEDRVQTDRVVQVVPSVVDVLFVVDDSCSMTEDRASIAAQFPAFVTPFEDAAVDWHVGVVTTDMDDPEYSGRLVEARGVKWLEADTPDPEGTFGEMVTGLDGGSTQERGREAAWTALDRLDETDNAGFLRDDPFNWLHFTVVSDADDSSDPLLISEQAFGDWVDFIRPYTDHTTFNSVVALVDGPQEEIGASYLRVTEDLGGISRDLNGADWGGILAELGGLQAPEATYEYFLSAVPVPETIDLKVISDGTTFTFAQGPDYTWSPVRDSVTFLSFLPPFGSTVEITYTVAASVVAGDAR